MVNKKSANLVTISDSEVYPVPTKKGAEFVENLNNLDFSDFFACNVKRENGKIMFDGMPFNSVKELLQFCDEKGPMDKSAPSWKRVCKALLRNDYWCKGLSFGQHKSEAYEKYKKLMRKRRSEWGII